MNKIQIHPIYIPGLQNQIADSLSRLEQAGDYQLNDKAQQFLHLNFQEFPKIDAFSTSRNHILPQFFTTTFNQQAIATDAFQQSWRNQSILIHPPIIMLQKVVRKISMEKPRGVVIAPDWVGQPWYSDLEILSSKKISLGPCVNNLKPGRRMKRRKTKLPPGDLVAWEIKTQMENNSSQV
ncbi:MAG: hypothetical protein EZS28_030136 [Streblomastix strix]|uniref:Uncharacterized protein n=1 Tax=Streblomastix strix TaxID=222440 RepID=A0A5J4UVI2_9EUKA|nr:MAG: hypothetical protein EZS28_030136 [Streblomastix strix]